MISILLMQSQIGSADPLLLTPTEMQKLKKYFPSSDVPPSQSSEEKKPDADATTAETTTTTDVNDTAVDPSVNMTEGDTYVALTRYAWQQLYAPTRLLSNPLSIHRVSMQTDDLQSTLIYGDKVIAHPLASWSLNNLYITAVSLRNQYPHPATLHVPQDICGDWVAAVMYPRDQLSPAGNKLSDSTTLFLLSRKTFNQATEVCHVSA
jgi:integrating conjugative element protein (TIGR03749 family)